MSENQVLIELTDDGDTLPFQIISLWRQADRPYTFSESHPVLHPQ